MVQDERTGSGSISNTSEAPPLHFRLDVLTYGVVDRGKGIGMRMDNDAE
jgi:hypothetical protein